jgi:uncharacterized protein (TIGR03118 family)
VDTGHKRWSWRVAAVGVSALALAAPAAAGSASSHSTYKRVNLVSDVPGRAQVTDPNLVNAWGAAYSPTSPLWVSDNGTDVSTLYDGGVHGGPQNIESLVVNIPGGAPTGQVFNPTSEFVVHGADGSSGSAKFLFVGESGHLTGWAPAVPATAPPPSKEAQDAVVTPGAIYKGLALAQTQTGPLLYAADFSAATVDVYNGSFQRVITEGNFEDRQLPAHFAPFNVAVLGGKVYVAYAKQDAEKEDEIAGHGLGRVDVFDLDGVLLHRLHQHGSLNAPWGLTIAPQGFGEFSGDLLVGNFGDGLIHAYNPTSLRLLGAVRNGHHDPIAIDGLWALLPGNGVEAGTDEIIFTAGPGDEEHGLLGTLSVRH